MKQKSGPDKAPAEQVLKDIRRQTRRQYSAEEKIRRTEPSSPIGLPSFTQQYGNTWQRAASVETLIWKALRFVQTYRGSR